MSCTHSLRNTIAQLRGLEKTFFDLLRRIDFTRYLLNPLNLHEEKSIFWSMYDRDKIYNPQYRYCRLPSDQYYLVSKIISMIPDLLKQVSKLDPMPLTMAFYKIVEEEQIGIALLQIVRNRSFSRYLTDLYGLPPPELVSQAIIVLSTCQLDSYSSEDNIIKSIDFANLIRTELELRDLHWQVIMEDGLGSRFSVVSTRKEVKVRNHSLFTLRDLMRFRVHEIDTHILRAENGRNQPLEMFATGLFGYIATEEGLATVMEEHNDVLSPDVIRKYAGRVLACSLIQQPFSLIVHELLRYFGRDDAFEIAHRVKRGLEDTSQPGGFTKDFIYLFGRKLVTDFLEKKGNLDKLYIGKIAIEQVDEMWALVDEGVLNKPKYRPITIS